MTEITIRRLYMRRLNRLRFDRIDLTLSIGQLFPLLIKQLLESSIVYFVVTIFRKNGVLPSHCCPIILKHFINLT